MTVLAIDPGSEQSAWVWLEGGRPWTHGIDANKDVLRRIYQGHWGDEDGRPFYSRPTVYVIEQIASYGMPVGAEVFETCVWTGRFMQEAESVKLTNGRIERVPRREVKLHLCQSARAKDSNVRTALLDRFGGEKAAKGTKAAPGPCYGLRKDEWAALALAVTWVDQHPAL